MDTSNTFTCCYYATVILLVLAQSIQCVEDDDKCETISPCVCEFSDDIVLDVATLSQNGFINATVPSQNLTYYFHGCTDAKLDLNILNITQNECKDKESTLCVYNRSSNVILSLGDTKTQQFINNVDNPKTHDLVFHAKETTISRIQLVCAPELTQDVLFAGIVTNEGKDHKLVLQSHKVCRQLNPHGMFTGSVILIILVVGLTIYFVGGAIMLRVLRGANGLEMIPHLEFWRDLPSLCRDGFLYLLHGCKTTAVPTSETYDRI